MSDRVENHIENKVGLYLQQWAREKGIDLEYIKLEAPGVKGYPNRVILWGPSQALFVEFKRPKMRPMPIQAHRHNKLISMGFEVRVYDNIQTAVAEITREIASTARNLADEAIPK